MKLLKQLGQAVILLIQVVTIGVVLGMLIPSLLFIFGVSLSPMMWFSFLSLGVTAYGGYTLYHNLKD